MSVASRAVASLSANGVAALSHARQGRPVFPCDAERKRPLLAKAEGGQGFKDATTDETLIRSWWSRWPEALIGMPTGAVTGCFIVDIDVKGEKQGEESWAAVLRTWGPVPETWETITATGGRHLWFAHPGRGLVVPNRAGRLGQGNETWGRGAYPTVPFAQAAGGQLLVPDVDIRGDGGYVILPGSLLRDGRGYVWEGSSDPEEGAVLATAPGWLLALVVTAEKAAGAVPVAGREPVAGLIGAGQRNDFLFRLGRSLRGKGLGEAAILAALLEENATRCDPPLPEAEVRASAASAASKAAGLSDDIKPAWLKEGVAVELAEVVPMVPTRPPPPPPENERAPLQVVGGKDFDARPLLRITAGRLAGDVDALEERLLGAGAEIYQQGTRLVRIGQWSAAEDIQRGSGAAVLIDVTAVWLRDCATRLVRFERWDAREKKWRATNCPNEMAETLLARAGGWKFASLLGFCDAPTVTTTGRLVHEPGYDVDSRLFLVHPPLIGSLGTVRPEAVAEASKYLFSLFDTFPFVTAADEAAALAMVLTTLVRRVLPAAPINCVSASTPGTGKSLLVNAIATLAVGRSAAVAAIGKDQEELEKRVDAVLLKGDALCSFDNVDRAVKSDVLCQVTTEAFKSVRILGLSRMVDAPTNVCWFMTGNNLTLLGDLVRRTLVCNLDAGMERPELRVFEREAIAYVRERRRQGIRAALTIVKGYLDAGCPAILVEGKPLRSFGSFEVWDRLVRRPLMWAGWPDPLQSAEGMREQDHEFGGMVDYLRALLEASEGKAMTTAEILGLMRERQGAYAEGHDGARWPALVEAGETVFGPAREWDAQKLGYRLRPWKQRVLGGLKLIQDEARGSRRNGRFWRVLAVR